MLKFVDDVGVLVVDQCIMKQLPGILTPTDIGTMADSDISAMASDAPGIVARRNAIQEKLKVLQEGRDQLIRGEVHPQSAGALCSSSETTTRRESTLTVRDTVLPERLVACTV